MTHDDVGWEVPEHPVGVDKPLVVHDRVQRAELAVELSPLEHGGDTALEMVRFARLDARQYSKFGEPATVLDAGQVTVDVQREHALARGDRCGDALGQILDNPLAGGRVVVGTPLGEVDVLGECDDGQAGLRRQGGRYPPSRHHSSVPGELGVHVVVGGKHPSDRGMAPGCGSSDDPVFARRDVGCVC